MPSCSNAWKTPGQLSVAQAPIFTACSTEQNAVQLLWITAAGEANHEPVCVVNGGQIISTDPLPLFYWFSPKILYGKETYFSAGIIILKFPASSNGSGAVPAAAGRGSCRDLEEPQPRGEWAGERWSPGTGGRLAA